MVAPKNLIFTLATLCSCGAPHPRIYAGDLHPVRGVCDSPLRAELSIRGNAVLFTPSSGTLILHGELADNAVSALATRVTPEHTNYTVSFAGRLTADKIDGNYVTPRCRYTVHLAATRD